MNPYFTHYERGVLPLNYKPYTRKWNWTTTPAFSELYSTIELSRYGYSEHTGNRTQTNWLKVSYSTTKLCALIVYCKNRDANDRTWTDKTWVQIKYFTNWITSANKIKSWAGFEPAVYNTIDFKSTALSLSAINSIKLS